MFGKKKDNIDDFDDPIYDGNLENEIPEETEEAETEEEEMDVDVEKAEPKTDFKKNLKKWGWLYGMTAALACALMLSFVHYKNTMDRINTTEIEQERTAGSVLSSDLLTDEIEDYVNTYFQTNGIKDFVSEEDIEWLSGQISAGVINSLPMDSLSDGQLDQVREIVNDAINNIFDGIVVDGDTINQTIIAGDEELKNYIDNTVVPKLTALIQINTGDIADLKASLAKLSSDYNNNPSQYDSLIDSLSSRVKALESSSATKTELNAIKSDFETLSSALTSYKSQTSSQITSLEKEIANIQKLMAGYDTSTDVDNKLSSVKATLLEKINSNADLNEKERKVLADSITNLSADSAKNLEDAKKQLQASIDASGIEQSAALKNAVDEIDGSLTDIYAQLDKLKADVTSLTQQQLNDLKSALLSQMENDSTLSEAERKLLKDSINNLSADSVKSLEDAKKQLQEAIAASGMKQSDALNNAVAGLNGTIEDLYNRLSKADAEILELTEANLEALKKSLLDQIGQNANLSEEERKLLQKSIDDLSADSVKSLDDAKKKLQEAIDAAGIQQSDALNSAVANLNTSINDLYDQISQARTDIAKLTEEQLSDLKATLSDQISKNADLSESERKVLEDSINDLSADSVKNLDDAKQQIYAEIKNAGIEQSDALNSAVDTLNHSLDDVYAKLAETSQTFQTQINQIISDQLSDCKIVYNNNDGHFYIEYEGGAGSVTKKLDYVQ